MKVLVTGGSGFLGRHVVPKLAKQGHHVVALARSSRAAEQVASLGADIVRGDLDDPVSIDEAFAAVSTDALVNIASLGFGHADTIVSAAQEAGVGRAIFVSTTAIFTGLAAKTKTVRVAAEATIMSSGLAWTILRPTMIYGTPDDRNLSRLLRLLARSPVVPLPGGGDRLQQPVHVDDVADAIVAALDASVAIGKAYDVAGPEPMTFRTLIEQAAAAVGGKPRLIPVPLSAALAIVGLYERLAPRPRITSEQVARLAEDKAFDISAARRELGYAPRPFDEGIADEAALLS